MAKKRGLAPGKIVYVGDAPAEPVRLEIMEFDEERLDHRTDVDMAEVLRAAQTTRIAWVNVIGVHNEEMLEKIGAGFDIPALAMEDIANTRHRPKYEEIGGNQFISLKMISHVDGGAELEIEQVSILVLPHVVITFQERAGDVWDPLRERIKRTVPRKRTLHSDYLAYALIDAIVDGYFVTLEEIGDQLEALEDQLLQDPLSVHTDRLYELRRRLISIRKAIWPIREVAGSLQRTEHELMRSETGPYLRDLYEHVIQAIDSVESSREMANGLLELYLSSVSFRTNEVMRVLTIIATIFIPLGFLAGVYGMNFDTEASGLNMPELGLPYGYILFWGLALGIGGTLLWLFRRKSWL
ncbi:MAG TPA: magnesium/cobalt transporter CorA [candidate division Zixibacteria bacterium]|nr:magnesium/cobalt transporter CorA [candidate division Zixibacteria bacterium]